MAATDISSESVRVVLLCAEDDEPMLVMAMQLLHLRGINAELVPGIDERPRRIGEVLDETRGDAVFVLCESACLDRPARLRLEGLFGARRGPGHVLVTTEVGVDSDDEVFQRVREAIPEATAAGAAARGEDIAHERRSKNRDVINMGAVQTTTPETGVPKTSRSVRKEPVAPQRDVTDEIAFDDLRPHERIENTPWDGPSSSEQPASNGPGQPKSKPKGKPKGKTQGKAKAGAARRWVTYAGISLAAALVTGLGVWALNLALGQPDRPSEGTEGVQAGAAAIPTRDDDVEPSPESRAQPTEDGTTDGETAAVDRRRAPPMPVARPGEDGSPEPLTGDLELLAIAKAVESGELRALDQLLAAPATDGSHNWLGAANRCKLTSIDGIGHWRLPTKEELWALRNARIAPGEGAYWSSTIDLSDADGSTDKDTALALVDGRIEGVHKREIRPKALCVRKR